LELHFTAEDAEDAEEQQDILMAVARMGCEHRHHFFVGIPAVPSFRRATHVRTTDYTLVQRIGRNATQLKKRRTEQQVQGRDRPATVTHPPLTYLQCSPLRPLRPQR